MPFATVQLQPGVKNVATPTLLKANIVASNLIRFRGGLAEKIGGWANFLSQYFAPTNPLYAISGITRALHAWTDNNGGMHLAAAGNNSGTGQLTVITNFEQTGGPNPPKDITPVIAQGRVSSVTSTFGSNSFTVVDGGFPPLPIPSAVTFNAHISVGGVVLFGAYPMTSSVPSGPSGQSYTITAPVPARGAETVTSVAQFSSTAGSNLVTVTLPNHGLSAGSNFSIPVATTIGSLTLQGFFSVVSAAPTFTYLSAATTTSAVISVLDANGNPTIAGIVPGMLVDDVSNPGAIPYGTTVSTVGGTNITLSHAPVGSIDAEDWIRFTSNPDTFVIRANATQTVAGTSTAFEANAPGAFCPTIYWPTSPPGSAKAGDPYPPPPTSVYTGLGPVSADSWTLGNFGSFLIACPINGPLFAWNPLWNNANTSLIISGPQQNRGFFIAMPQQQIVVYGASVGGVEDPLMVAWCDNANFSVWTPSATNQAGTYRLTRGSRIISGCQGPQTAVLWTDVGIWAMTYLGFPDVWGFNEIGQGCGIIGKDAWCTLGPQLFWMGHDGFWVFAQGAVQRVDCDIWDAIFRNINQTQSSPGVYKFFGHIKGCADSDANEVSWRFPSAASTTGENDAFVKYNVLTHEWDFSFTNPQPGMSSATPIYVTAWLDQNILGHALSSMLPIIGATTSLIMQHDVSQDANGHPLTWMVQTGFFSLSEGEDKVFVDYILPDFRWRRWPLDPSVSATVLITLFTCDDPDNPETAISLTNPTAVAYGPYAVTNDTTNGVLNRYSPGGIEVRCRGRYFFAIIQGNDMGSFVRMGGIRFRFQPDGRN